MMKNKPLVRSCSVCSAREQSYSLREWSCTHLGMLSVTLQREMDYLSLLYHSFIHHVLPFTSYMTLGSNSTSSEKPCALATSSSLIHCFHSCKKTGSNHMRAQMPSAQPKTKQLCCDSSSVVAPNRAARSADGAQRNLLGLGGQGCASGNEAKLSASSCCRDTWSIPVLEAPSQAQVAFARSRSWLLMYPCPRIAIVQGRRMELEGISGTPAWGSGIRLGSGRFNSKQV